MRLLRRSVTLLALLSAGISTLPFVENRPPRGVYLWLPKLLAGALAPFFGLLGLAGATAGLVSQAWLAVATGIYSALAVAKLLDDTVGQPQRTMDRRFRHAFGPAWPACLAAKTTAGQRAAMLQKRWYWLLPEETGGRWLRDLPFWRDTEAGRTLLCDVWLPPQATPRTGLGLLYFHGSAWCLGDKDLGTRSLFRHLAAQGHVVVDAQFRLVPETDMAGMLADAKRAVAWFKANAQVYDVNPAHVVTAGFSAGAQLALLAAYAPHDRALTPPELWDADLSVCGVVSYAGSYDLHALYDHGKQWLPVYRKLAAQDEAVSTLIHRLSDWVCCLIGRRGQAEALARKGAHLAIAAQLPIVLGGSPTEVPEAYTRYSPITYVGPDVPPTFMVQGADDIGAPLAVASRLEGMLRRCGVPVMNLVFAHAEHGFDLVLRRFSPPAQSALYELDRFLALLQSPGRSSR